MLGKYFMFHTFLENLSALQHNQVSGKSCTTEMCLILFSSPFSFFLASIPCITVLWITIQEVLDCIPELVPDSCSSEGIKNASGFCWALRISREMGWSCWMGQGYQSMKPGWSSLELYMQSSRLIKATSVGLDDLLWLSRC